MKTGECGVCHNVGPLVVHHTQYGPEARTVEICPNCHAGIHYGDLRPDLRPGSSQSRSTDIGREIAVKGAVVDELHVLLSLTLNKREEHERMARILVLAERAIVDEIETVDQTLAELRVGRTPAERSED